MKVGVKDLPLAHARVLLGQRLLHFEDHLRALPYLVGGGNELRTGNAIFVVADA